MSFEAERADRREQEEKEEGGGEMKDQGRAKRREEMTLVKGK